MNIRLNKGTIVAIASASLIASAASATENIAIRDLGSAAKLRSSLISDMNQSSPYAGSEAKEGEGKCGEGKCGEGKCGDEEKKAGEGKCGEGKCGEGESGDE